MPNDFASKLSLFQNSYQKKEKGPTKSFQKPDGTSELYRKILEKFAIKIEI